MPSFIFMSGNNYFSIGCIPIKTGVEKSFLPAPYNWEAMVRWMWHFWQKTSTDTARKSNQVASSITGKSANPIETLQMKSCFQRAFINGLVEYSWFCFVSCTSPVTTSGLVRSWKHIKRTVKLQQSVWLGSKIAKQQCSSESQIHVAHLGLLGWLSQSKQSHPVRRGWGAN